MSLSHRNQSIDLPCKSIDWFLCERDILGYTEKTAYAFGVSGVSISSTIRRVSHAVTTFLGPQLIKFPKTEMEVKELVNKFLETYGFTQCIGAIDSIHTETKE